MDKKVECGQTVYVFSTELVFDLAITEGVVSSIIVQNGFEFYDIEGFGLWPADEAFATYDEALNAYIESQRESIARCKREIKNRSENIGKAKEKLKWLTKN